MKRLAVVVAAVVLVAAVAVVPPAGARPQSTARSQGIAAGIVTGIATEVAKQGAKALILHFAPDLEKHIDPTAHALRQIQEQLAQLDAKITELAVHQRQLENTLSCKLYTSALEDELSAADAATGELASIGTVTEQSKRVSQLDLLYPRLHQLAVDQRTIHNTLVHGALIDCAKHIQDGMAPYLSSALAGYVRDFYATYKAAELGLFVVRANLMGYNALKPGGTAREVIYTEGQIQAAANETSAWINEEEALIKPAFPDTESYDTKSGTLWRTATVNQSDHATIKALAAAGWHVTGHSTIPTCSAVQAFVQQAAADMNTAINRLYQLNVLRLPSLLITCYDDHDHLQQFNLVTGQYHYAGNIAPTAPSVAARPNNGLIDIARHSY